MEVAGPPSRLRGFQWFIVTRVAKGRPGAVEHQSGLSKDQAKGRGVLGGLRFTW